MSRYTRLLAASAVGVIALASSPAFAAGTVAGTTITNTVTVNYKVGGVSQTAQTASNTVTVDRSVNLTVTSGATTPVSPGQTGAAIKYTVTNTSNDTLDFALSAAQQAGGTAANGGTDVFDTTNVKIYADTNNNGVYDPGTDLPITYLDEVAPDTSRTVFVVSDIPVAQTNGQVAGIILTAQAAAGGTAGSQGTTLTATSGANTAGIDTVFADGAGAGDSANDGKYAAKGDYTVSAPVLTITKVSTLINDPVNGTTNPKAIPGATIEYCIVVANAAGAATAQSLAVSDALPATVSYVSGFGILLNGSASGTAPSYTCSGGTAGGTYDTPTTTVSGTLADLAAGSTETLRFRATIK
ncbi:MAG: DUF11 domain-containing protein [Sphingomonadales bacterium]|nr:DUF11 domain-containing protein [Sphingomonadales bacterium]MDE2569774.1 DUF11 domain-containing protein [Sphingomonadales bacterium]